MVWHFRRNTVKAYINQQRGYGKAEALVYAKHPFRFNLFGQAKWLGRIYGDLSAALLLSRKPVIYSGTFGRGLFQTMYEPPSSLTVGAAADLRVERRGARAGAGGRGRRRLDVAVGGAAADDLGDVRQRRAEGPDRPALHGAEGARAGGPADLSRAAAARLGAHQMALQDDADAGPHPARAGRAEGARRPGSNAPSCCATGTKAGPRKRCCSAA